MIGRLWRGASRRALLLLGAVLALLAAAPVFVSGYVLSILILALYFAYVGQAWNVMMGFAGQLSLGHALYVGLGAYVIAFAEFTRIGFDHLDWVGGSGGLFLRVTPGYNDVLNLRGTPVMFYYVALTLAVAAFLVCAALKASRIGYYWLAIREDEEAARALGVDAFRYKMAAVLISSAMTALAGVFFAFYYNNLFPEQIFNIGRSIELLLGPIIGGLGTLFGPILGAFVLQVLAEGLRALLVGFGWEMPGAYQVFYGVALLLVVMFLPNGIWPSLSRALGLASRQRP